MGVTGWTSISCLSLVALEKVVTELPSSATAVHVLWVTHITLREEIA